MSAPLLSLAYPRLWRPNTVPTFPVVLDRSRLLARNLGDFVLFGSGQNLAAPAYPLSAVGTARRVAASSGAAGFTPGTGTDYFSLPNRTNLATADFGVSLLFQPISVSAAYAVLWDKGSGIGSREMSLFVDTSLNLNYESIGTSQNVIAVSTGMSFGKSYEVTLTRSGGSNCTVYINGSSVGTFTEVSAGAGPSSTAFGSNISGGGANTSANFIRWATWQNYCPTASEVAQFAAEPFAMLRPVVRRQYYAATAAVPPPAGDEMLFHPVF